MITKQKIKKLIVIFCVMLVLILTCVFHSRLHPFFINLFAEKFKIISNKDNLLVHFISVGQADATAINLPDGKVMLIDTGTQDVNTTYVNYIKENVLHTKRKDYIDYLVLSHADMDHVGGTMKLLKNFEIGTVYLPKIASNSIGYAEILSFVENNFDFITLGEEFIIKTELYKITFFEILNNSNTNDSSQVLKLESDNKSFLFTGDITARVEQLYIKKYGDELDCDILKVSHHGSNSSTSTEFLEFVTPEYAVISVGFGNDYGHPTYDVLERLKSVGTEILRTDKHDDILFVVGDDYNLKLMNKTYYITRLSLDYVGLVMVVDGLLIVLGVLVLIKKEKNKHLIKK